MNIPLHDDGSDAPARRGRKPGFTREQITRTALQVADREGVAALTFRRLATELDVSPMAPYRYFEDKDDLLDAMVGHALSTLITTAGADRAWHEQLSDAMRDLRAALTAHPTLAELLTTHYIHDDRLNEFRDHLFTIVGRSGLSRQEAADVLRALSDYILGSAIAMLRRGPRRHRESASAFELGLSMFVNSVRSFVDQKVPPR